MQRVVNDDEFVVIVISVCVAPQSLFFSDISHRDTYSGIFVNTTCRFEANKGAKIRALDNMAIHVWPVNARPFPFTQLLF